MKVPTGRPAKHPVEFMMAVAKQVVDGKMTQREAAKRYGVSHGSISSWKAKYGKGTLHMMKQPKRRNFKSPSAKEQVLESEIKALKLELANLYMQVQMLKKAEEFSEQARRDASSIITSENLDQFKEAVSSSDFQKVPTTTDPAE